MGRVAVVPAPGRPTGRPVSTVGPVLTPGAGLSAADPSGAGAVTAWASCSCNGAVEGVTAIAGVWPR